MSFSRDDFPVVNAYIDSDCLNEFREIVISCDERYRNFSAGEFLTRSYIFSGKYLTFAGALMFGNIIRVRATLDYEARHVEIEALNIWKAYTNILPRLICKLSAQCRKIYREAFINALLNSDYCMDNKINVIISPNPPRVLIDYPGLINSNTRNNRLQKIFELAGILRDEHISQRINIEQDVLNLRVKASFELEGPAELPQPVIL